MEKKMTQRNSLSLNNTFLKYGIIEVTRNYSGVNFIEGNLSKDEELMVITEINMSNPNKTLSTILTKNDKTLYLQYVGTPEYALIGIILACNDELKDNLIFYHDINSLNTYLNTNNKLPNFNLNLDFTLLDLAGLKGLNGLLFAILAGSPIISLNNNEQITKKLFLALLSLLPPELAKNILITTYSESYEDDFDFIGMPINQETAKIVEEHSDTHTIVDFEREIVFSLFECPATSQLAKAIELKYVEEIVKFLTMIYEKAWRANEIVKKYKEEGNIEDDSIVADIAEFFKCSKADAEFYFILGNRLSIKPIINERRIR